MEVLGEAGVDLDDVVDEGQHHKSRSAASKGGVHDGASDERAHESQVHQLPHEDHQKPNEVIGLE